MCGKPSVFSMELLERTFGISRDRTLMIGDRLDTDIRFGIDAGCKTCCVLSGVSALDEVMNDACLYPPDFVVSSLSDLVLP